MPNGDPRDGFFYPTNDRFLYSSFFRDLESGDHLAVDGQYCRIPYSHHGIFLGHKEGIADIGEDDQRSDGTETELKPRNVDLFQFTDYGKRTLYRYIYPPGKCNTPEAAVHLANEVIQHPDLWGPYSLRKNNCEHFATRCKTGKAYSLQVEAVKRNPLKLVKDSMEAKLKSCFALNKNNTVIN